MGAHPAHAPMALSGTVVLDGENPELTGVVITLEGTTLTATTDESGAFTMSPLPAPPWILVVDDPRYAPLRVLIDAVGASKPITLTLAPRDSETFSVTITAPTSTPDTASTTRITARDIAAAPHRNAEEVLRQVPGLTLVQHGSEGKGHQFFLRGFDAIHGADLEITLDGIPINEWSNIHAQGYLDLGLILPEVIQTVVVTKGPFTLDQGAFAMAGTADYQWGVPYHDLGGRAAYTIGTTHRHRLFLGMSPPESDGRQFVAMDATHDDGFGQNRRLDRATLNARVDLMDEETAGRLSLFGAATVADFDLPGALRNSDVQQGVVDFYDTYDKSSEGQSARALLGLNYHWEQATLAVDVTGYGGFRRLEFLENFTGYLADPQWGDRRGQHQQTGSFGVSGKVVGELVRTLSIYGGLGFRGEWLDQKETHVGPAKETLTTRREAAGTQWLGHASVGFQWWPWETVRLDAGARGDLLGVNVSDKIGETNDGSGVLGVVSPRVTARWRPMPGLSTFVAYGRGFRPPEMRAFTSYDPSDTGFSEEVGDNQKPAITVSDSAEIGGRWDPNPWFGVAISGFLTWIERESVFDHVSGTSLELNGTRRIGGEIEIHTNPVPYLTLSADLTFADAKFIESGNQVPFAPWLVAGFRGIVTHDSGFHAGIRTLVVAPRPLPHGAKGATLVMVDLTTGFHWQFLRVDVEVENLLAHHNREGEYHYASHFDLNQPRSEIPALHTTAGAPINARLTVGVVF